MSLRHLAACAALVAVGSAPLATAQSADAPTALESQKRDTLIYSVDRTPERLFDTSRADSVLTADDIGRADKSGLAALLEEQAGIVVSWRPSGGTAIIRGLGDKQVLILVDGVKVNNATWGGTDVKEYLNLIPLDEIDRIEIVRGVVSVSEPSIGRCDQHHHEKGAAAGRFHRRIHWNTLCQR